MSPEQGSCAANTRAEDGVQYGMRIGGVWVPKTRPVVAHKSSVHV